MKFYRFFVIFAIAALLAGCIGEDYKLWGSGKSGNYSYQDIKRENAGKKLLTVVFANPARLDQATAEKFVVSGLSKRYESDKPDRKVQFTTNPIDATTSESKLVIQFDTAKNVNVRNLCNVTTPLAFREITEESPIYMAVVFCKYDKARAWIRGESLSSSMIREELIELIALNSLNRMTMPSFGDDNNRSK